jgi:hypothetical protein
VKVTVEELIKALEGLKASAEVYVGVEDERFLEVLATEVVVADYGVTIQ